MLAATDFPVENADLRARLATGGYFRILGVEARLGRVFTEDDDRASAPPVAVISDSYWQRAFGGRADALGRRIAINNASVTVIGVAPPEFFGERVGGVPDVWVPMSHAAQVWNNLLNSRGVAMLSPMARLRPDIPVAQAQAGLNVLYGQLTEFSMRMAGTNQFRLELKAGSQGLRELQERFSAPLGVLMGIAGLVMLIACCNLANLLLARAAARTHEMGVRLALGAARARLIRQLLTESLVLAGLGSMLGLVVAAWGSRELVALASVGHPWRIAMETGWRVPVFAAGVTILAACLFGLAPALAATKLDVNSALQASGRTQSGSRSRARASRFFVIAQVSISLLLIAAASLLVRSFWNLQHQDFGYRQEGVLMVEMRIDFATLRAAREIAVQPVYERMNAIPGVRSAALAGLGPFSPVMTGASIALPERPPLGSDDAHPVGVSPRFFETMGIPIVAGRAITEDDRAETTKVAVISETAVRRVFGAANPLGRYFTNGKQFDASKAIQIVGVARDIRLSGPRDPFGAIVYQPLAQEPAPLTSVMLRTAGDPALFAEVARQAVREAVPRLKITAIRPLGDVVGSQLGQERMMALLSAAFGLLALVLAGVGLYGVMAYGVERRTQEMGIRLALGASRGQVSGLLLREAALVLAVGLAVGTAATVALGQAAKAMLFGLTPHDPAMLLCAAVLLSMVGAVASYFPARRAARIDPARSLRQG
jgi:predicted permease